MELSSSADNASTRIENESEAALAVHMGQIALNDWMFLDSTGFKNILRRITLALTFI